MAGDQEIRGSKNLGLIQAVYTGTTPPVNTKIIWYDDRVGQKIHKYYDVTTSTWIPFGGSGTVVSGSFVYIAFASSCDGDDFSLIFDSELHTKTAVITSQVELPSGQITPDKFAGRWVTFCSANSGGGGTGGNYTYLAFADDCEGSNFSLEPTYEVECGNCKTVNNYIPFNMYQINYSVTPNRGGVDININNGIAPKKIELSLKMDGQDLDQNIEYYIEIQIPSTWRSKFFVRLDATEIGGYLIEPDGTNKTFKFEKVNKSSRLILEFYDLENRVLNDTIFAKVGTLDCATDTGSGTCLKSRSCWAFLVSDTPIATPDLTVDLFEGLWFCACCGDGGVSEGEIKNIKQLVSNLIGLVTNQQQPVYDELASLLLMIQNLQTYVDNEFEDLETLIINNNNTINQILVDINAEIQSIWDAIGLINIDIQELQSKFNEPGYTNSINAIIAQYLIDHPNGGDGEPYNALLAPPPAGSFQLNWTADKMPSWRNYYTNNDFGGGNMVLPPVADTKKKTLIILNGNNQFKLAAKTGDKLFHHGIEVPGSIGITENQVVEIYNNETRWTILNIY